MTLESLAMCTPAIFGAIAHRQVDDAAARAGDRL